MLRACFMVLVEPWNESETEAQMAGAYLRAYVP